MYTNNFRIEGKDKKEDKISSYAVMRRTLYRVVLNRSVDKIECSAGIKEDEKAGRQTIRQAE